MSKKIIFWLIGLIFLIPHVSEAKTDFKFNGQLDLLTKEYVLTIDFGDKGFITTKLTESAKNQFALAVNVDHLKVSLTDLTTELEGVIELKDRDQETWSLSGKVWSRYSLVNYKPSEEFVGSFHIKDQKLIFDPISLGIISCRGSIDLIRPYQVDLALDLRGVAMKDFLGFFSKENQVDSGGLVDGKIKIKGELGAFILEGELASEYGYVGKMEFEKIVLNAQGLYPNIFISDSSITQSDGTIFSFGGSINLSDTGNFKTQIETLNKTPLVNTDGRKHEWTFKRSRTKGESGKTELKYLLNDSDTLKDLSSSGADMLGVERTIEF